MDADPCFALALDSILFLLRWGNDEPTHLQATDHRVETERAPGPTALGTFQDSLAFGLWQVKDFVLGALPSAYHEIERDWKDIPKEIVIPLRRVGSSSDGRGRAHHKSKNSSDMCAEDRRETFVDGGYAQAGSRSDGSDVASDRARIFFEDTEGEDGWSIFDYDSDEFTTITKTLDDLAGEVTGEEACKERRFDRRTDAEDRRSHLHWQQDREVSGKQPGAVAPRPEDDGDLSKRGKSTRTQQSSKKVVGFREEFDKRLSTQRFHTELATESLRKLR